MSFLIEAAQAIDTFVKYGCGDASIMVYIMFFTCQLWFPLGYFFPAALEWYLKVLVTIMLAVLSAATARYMVDNAGAYVGEIPNLVVDHGGRFFKATVSYLGLILAHTLTRATFVIKWTFLLTVIGMPELACNYVCRAVVAIRGLISNVGKGAQAGFNVIVQSMHSYFTFLEYSMESLFDIIWYVPRSFFIAWISTILAGILLLFHNVFHTHFLSTVYNINRERIRQRGFHDMYLAVINLIATRHFLQDANDLVYNLMPLVILVVHTWFYYERRQRQPHRELLEQCFPRVGAPGGLRDHIIEKILEGRQRNLSDLADFFRYFEQMDHLQELVDEYANLVEEKIWAWPQPERLRVARELGVNQQRIQHLLRAEGDTVVSSSDEEEPYEDDPETYQEWYDRTLNIAVHRSSITSFPAPRLASCSLSTYNANLNNGSRMCRHNLGGVFRWL